jgi:hypothetical protein
MKKPDPLKEVEQRAYRATFDDGLYDLLFGLIFLILAWIPLLDLAGVPRSFGYSLVLVAALVLWLGKRHITIPRLGAVEFGPKRKARRRLFLLIAAAALFVMMPVAIMTFSKGLPIAAGEGLAVPLVVGLVAAPFLVVAAYVLDYPRLFIYALILCFGIPHAQFLYEFVGTPFNSLISFGLPGAAVFIYGLTLLFKFMKKYPKPSPEASFVSR